MSLFTRVITAFLVSGITAIAYAQLDSLSHPELRRNVPLSEQRDVLDVARKLLPFLHLKSEADTVTLPVGRTFVWVLVEGGYSLQTRLLVEIQGNIAYRRPGANVSTIIPAIAYSQNKQIFFATRLNSWTRNNHFNWVGDVQLHKYPQATFGIGTLTKPTDELRIDFTYLRLYQTLLKRVSQNTYVGLGYHLDYHWAIKTLTKEGDETTIPNYGIGTQGQSVSSDLSFFFTTVELTPKTPNRLHTSMSCSDPTSGFWAAILITKA